MRRALTTAGLAALPVAVVLAFFVVPVTGMVQAGFVTDGRFSPTTVVRVFGRDEIQRALWFTVTTATAGTFFSVLFGLPAAYALHRLTVPLRRVIRAALLVPFVLPTVVVGVAFRELLRDGGPLGFLGLDGSPIGIVAGLVFFNVAVVIRTVGAAWEGLDPRPGEAAAALGASPLTVFRTVTWPALRPSVVGSASVVFLFCATAFGVVLTMGGLRYNSIETEIYKLTTQLVDLPGAAALSILQLLVIVVLLVISGRLRQSPDPTHQRSLARPSRPRRHDTLVVALTVFLLAFVAAPILSLVVGSFQVDGHWSLENYRAMTTTGDAGTLAAPVTSALQMSLRTAVDATVLALVLGLLVAIVVSRRSHNRSERRLRSVLDGFFMLPLGVSAVTLGFGLYITLDTDPMDFRGATWLVPVAQALVALPLVVRTLAPVLGSIDDRQRQSAASLGAGPLRTFMTVDLPVMWKPLLAAAGFAFAVSLGEFGATSFLYRGDTATLPVVIGLLLTQPGELHYGMALAASCVLAAATGLVMFVVDRLQIRSIGAF